MKEVHFREVEKEEKREKFKKRHCDGLMVFRLEPIVSLRVIPSEWAQ